MDFIDRIRNTGGSSIDAVAGDQLVAEVRVFPDPGGVRVYAFSVSFDPDLGNELDLVAATEFLPAQMELNFSPGTVTSVVESTGAQGGFVYTIEAAEFSILGPTTGTMVAAELTFDVTANVATDGTDLTPGEFGLGEGMGDNSNTLVTPVFVGASVNLAGSQVPSLSAPAVIVVSSLMALAGVGAILHRRYASRT